MPNDPRALDYSIVDVFTTQALSGNPLAVVMNTVGLTTAQMQAIAREFNLSETTFVERRPADIEAAEGIRVRIFTTLEELPFAGHPTLGTASVLRLVAPETLRGSTITLAENVGPIPVEFPQPGASFAEMTQRDPEFGPELSPSDVARLCSLSVDDLDPSAPPQVVSTGTAFAIVLLRSVEALGRLRVHHDQATPFLRAHGARWFYVVAPAPGENAENGMQCFRTRMQFYGAEDPATGSAAGCAVSYLVQRKVAPSGTRFLLRQGVEMGRPSDIFVSAQAAGARVTQIRVAGSTVLVAKGTFFLP
ncbi:PhzF family phenazine biosynthesis protein [Acidobacteria bacterium AB60]|nr:PhzF family phenazine biosynthesis protein [Acidobacteria bacterium AB60]